jgi:integrase
MPHSTIRLRKVSELICPSQHLLTFQELLDGFVEKSKAKVISKNYGKLREQYFLTWTEHPTFLQIEDWHGSLCKTPHQANSGLWLLKAMYTWAIRRGLYPGPNPATEVKAHRTFSRERVMTSQEVALLLHTLDLLPAKLGVLLVVLLTTGCRLSEARQMQPQHVNLSTGAWLQPKTKNGKPHTTYLSTQAREAIALLPHSEDYIFDGLLGQCYSLNGAGKAWQAVRPMLGLQDVHLHDFRHTFATHLSMATKDDFLVKRCLNHTNPSVTAIYVRISQEEVAAAMQAQADRFWALQAGPVALQSPAQEELAPVAFC